MPKWFIVVDAQSNRSEFVRDFGYRQSNKGNDVEFVFYDVEKFLIDLGQKKKIIHYRNPKEVWLEGKQVYPEK